MLLQYVLHSESGGQAPFLTQTHPVTRLVNLNQKKLAISLNLSQTRANKTKIHPPPLFRGRTFPPFLTITAPS
jgi:hypothetical protein